MTIRLFGKKIFIKTHNLVLIILISVIILGYIGYRLIDSGTGVIIKTEANTLSKSGDSVKDSTDSGDKSAADMEEGKVKADETKDEIQVYVAGCVNKPGVYTLERGQIINDAIEMAGGLTKEADISNVNLVYKLYSNVRLKIKSREEISNLNEDCEVGIGVEIEAGHGGIIADGTAGGGKININTAAAQQMKEALPGIGDVVAGDIVKYREENGAFEKIEDIMKVPGIKEGRFQAIKDLITVD
jgi:competence protein ComEA